MIDYPTYGQLRHLRDQAHLTIAQIARQLGLHWQTGPPRIGPFVVGQV